MTVPHSALHTTSARPTLAADCTGAIMVVGIVMGLLLVGALWNIVSIGDAILWRERLQDAADAAAFEAAVWNARGMNVIVFLNIVMAGAMAILVALRGAIIFLTALVAALTAARAACLFPVTPITAFLCGISWFATAAQTAHRTVTNLENRLNPPIQRFLTGVQTAQTVVATVVPLISVKESALRTSSEYNMPAVGLSPSLLPTSPGAGPVVGGDLRNSMPRIGRLVSLPVSLDGEWKLCEEAGQFIPNELLAMLEAAGVGGWILDGAGGFFRTVAGAIAGSMPAIFCGDRSPQDIRQLTDMFRNLARDNCAGARQSGRVSGNSGHSEEDRRTLEQYQDYWREGFIGHADGPPDRGYVFDTARCEREQLQQVTQNYRPNRGVRAARVWRYTLNGDFFLQAWGLAHYEAPQLAGNDRAIDFPARGQAASVPADVYELGTAQSEIYWDTGTGSGCDGSWASCQPETMWLMRWKARLRRVHDPRQMAARSLANIAVAELVNGMHQGINALVRRGEGAFANWARGTRWELVSHFIRGNLWDTAYLNRGNVFGQDPLGWVARQTVGKMLAQDPPAPNEVIIH